MWYNFFQFFWSINLNFNLTFSGNLQNQFSFYDFISYIAICRRLESLKNKEIKWNRQSRKKSFDILSFVMTMQLYPRCFTYVTLDFCGFRDFLCILSSCGSFFEWLLKIYVYDIGGIRSCIVYFSRGRSSSGGCTSSQLLNQYTWVIIIWLLLLQISFYT